MLRHLEHEKTFLIPPNKPHSIRRFHATRSPWLSLGSCGPVLMSHRENRGPPCPLFQQLNSQLREPWKVPLLPFLAPAVTNRLKHAAPGQYKHTLTTQLHTRSCKSFSHTHLSSSPRSTISSYHPGQANYLLWACVFTCKIEHTVASSQG